jgi:hypothetical protein
MRNRPGFQNPDYLVLLILVVTIAFSSAIMFVQLRHFGYDGPAIIVAILGTWMAYLAFIALAAYVSKPFLPTSLWEFVCGILHMCDTHSLCSSCLWCNSGPGF